MSSIRPANTRLRPVLYSPQIRRPQTILGCAVNVGDPQLRLGSPNMEFHNPIAHLDAHASLKVKVASVNFFILMLEDYLWVVGRLPGMTWHGPLSGEWG